MTRALEPVRGGDDLGQPGQGHRPGPKADGARALSGRGLVLLVVVLPTLLAALYFGLVASDRYVSESRFLVRSASSPTPGGLASFLRTVGFARADDDAFAVQSYILSRDALRDLSASLPMRAMLDRDGTDVLSRCSRPWADESFEQLYRCYLSRVRVTREDETGISRLVVDLFDPDDSLRVSQTLLRLGETLANGMNARAEADALAHATGLLAEAEARVVEAQGELTAFRNRELLIDIEGRSEETNSVIAALAGELAETRALIDQQQRLSPGSPQTAALRVRAEVLEAQIREQRLGLTGGEDALADRMSAYETLVLRRTLADEALGLASAAIDRARQEARRQRIYLETVVAPNRADRPIRPERLRAVATVLLCSLFLCGLLWLFVVGGREHLNRAG